MRVFVVTAGSLLALFVCFMIAKLWGQSQTYPEYNHAMYSISSQPIEFVKPKYENLEKDLKEKEFLFLDVVVTQDQKLVIAKRAWDQKEKPIRYSTMDEIKKDVLNLQDFKDSLRQKKIIFNLVENSMAEHENFVYNMKELSLEKGENFIVMSPYEAPIKALKEIAPSYLFGTTQPEILKILAMGSMYLYEAANIRADVIIHPLKIRKQTFFTEDLLKEIARRHKRFIVGPIEASEKEEALKLQPYGIIVED